MNGKIIYLVAFILAFAFVTGALIFANTMYKNIFKFDFTSVGETAQMTEGLQNKEQNQTDGKNGTPNEGAKPDSTKINNSGEPDSTHTISVKDTNAVAKVQKAIIDQNDVNANTVKKEVETSPLSTVSKQKSVNNDSSYQKWIKQTVKLYESMDTKKAAKIIQGYSDNIARDILLTMKKKKAADIIAEFRPEIATRIISEGK